MTGWVALLLGTGEQTFSLVIKNHEMKYLLNYIYIDNNQLILGFGLLKKYALCFIFI